jgi:hypothetical protein
MAASSAQEYWLLSEAPHNPNEAGFPETFELVL